MSRTRKPTLLTLSLCALTPLISACGDDHDPVFGDSTWGEQDEDGDGAPEVCDNQVIDDMDCSTRALEAHEKPHIEGCFGAPLDAAPAQNPGGLDFLYPGAVADGATREQVGVWTPIADNEGHMPIHSIHRPTGKFLQFGTHQTGGHTADKAVWHPPAPCLDPLNDFESCETTFDTDPSDEEIQMHWEVPGTDPDMTDVNLFCAGHVNMPPQHSLELSLPRTLTVGGSIVENSNVGMPSSYMFWEEEGPLPELLDHDWVQVDDLTRYRWYPTATVLADARIAVPGGVFSNKGMLACKTSIDGMEMKGVDCVCSEGDYFSQTGQCGGDGYCLADTAAEEAGEPPPNGFDACWYLGDWTKGMDLGTRTGDDAISWNQEALAEVFGSYPQMFVLPDLPEFEDNHLGGTYVKVGSETNWNEGGALLWDPAAPSDAPKQLGGMSCASGSSAVMYASDKILKFGGRDGGVNGIASRETEVLDLASGCPRWRSAGPTGMPRHFSSGVLLPDGGVLAVGGSASSKNLGDAELDDGTQDERFYTVFTTELFEPTDAPLDEDAGNWCRLADMPQPEDEEDMPNYRGYHSQGFLLPDGRIYVGAGGNADADSENHFDYNLYSPPYLFWGERPQVAPGPAETVTNDVLWMETDTPPIVFTETENVEIERVTMVKLSSATHNFDQEQRFVELELVVEDFNDEFHVLPPTSTCYATPGYYMLFAISTDGVPSIGQYVAVTGSCSEADEPAALAAPRSAAPRGINDWGSDGTDGLTASCAGDDSTLSLADFGRSLAELCTAGGGCPDAGTVDLEVLLASTDGTEPEDGAVVLATTTVSFADGVPTFSDDGPQLDVAGYGQDASPLGPGDHLLSLCGGLGSLTACIPQPLRIQPVLAGDSTSTYRAAAIEQRILDLDVLPTVPLAPGPDGAIEVPLPEGFSISSYGEEVSSLWVGENGAVRFDDGEIPRVNTTLSNPEAPQLAVYWDDLDLTQGGKIRTYTDHYRFVVEWSRVAIGSGGRVSAQLHLFRDGRVEMHYPALAEAPAAIGSRATIGIRGVDESLELSLDDPQLLAAVGAVAFDFGSCIASDLRMLDSAPCSDRVTAPPLEVAICGGHGDVFVPTPEIANICSPNVRTSVGGEVWAEGQRLRPQTNGTLRLAEGNYEAIWTMREPGEGPNGTTYWPVGERTTQAVHVSVVDDGGVCCRSDQEAQVLTSKGDGHSANNEVAVCISALEGDDTVSTGDSDDTLLGHDGNDNLFSGGGDDLLMGGRGKDRMFASWGNDTLRGGPQSDILNGGPDDDSAWGDDGDDYVYGGEGRDVLVPGSGSDLSDGGAGDDTIVIIDICEVENGERIDGGEGTDTLLLPPDVKVEDLLSLGATVTSIERFETIEDGKWGTAGCVYE